jgi:hypothetical protein
MMVREATHLRTLLLQHESYKHSSYKHHEEMERAESRDSRCGFMCEETLGVIFLEDTERIEETNRAEQGEESS